MEKTASYRKKVLSVLCAMSLFTGILYTGADTACARRSLKINYLSRKKITVRVGKRKSIRVKKPIMIKGVKWKVKNKKIAAVKRKSKYVAAVTGKKAGKTKLYAKFRVDSRVSGNYYKTAVIVVKGRTGGSAASGTAVSAAADVV